MSTYRVVETPHGDPASAKNIAEFATRHEALITAAKSLRAHLTALAQPGLNAREMLALWRNSGTGYRIEPEDSSAPFCDIDYARLYVLRLTDDYSHPLFLEVTTADCLRTVSGVNSPARTWKFWVKAPSTYEGEGLEALMKAGVEVLYDAMSQQSQDADGSTYVLLKMSFRAVSNEEAMTAMRADPSATTYFVQNDGSFGRNLPLNPMAAAR